MAREKSFEILFVSICKHVITGIGSKRKITKREFQQTFEIITNRLSYGNFYYSRTNIIKYYNTGFTENNCQKLFFFFVF